MWTRAIAVLSKMKNMWLKNMFLPMLKVRLKSLLFEYWIQRLVTMSILLSLCRALPHSCEHKPCAAQHWRCIIVMNIMNILHSFCACVHSREFVNACESVRNCLRVFVSA